jgi:hypothetical protein
MRAELPVKPLPFVPRLYDDETLWSWLTRMALFWGVTADEWSAKVGAGNESWQCDSPPMDVDCTPVPQLIELLSQLTGLSSHKIREHIIPRVPSTLWLDDRVAFCERCFDEMAHTGSPYVRSVWLDAWCIKCPIHRLPLCTVREARRPRQHVDWNRVWAAKRSWAAATLAVLPDPHPGLMHRGEAVLWYPPTECLSGDDWIRYPSRPLSATGWLSVEGTRALDDAFERALVILAGQVFSDFSMARAFFNVNERLEWRNTWKGLDETRPVCEPLGSLATRACALRVGAALADILLKRPPQDELTERIRELMRALNSSTRALINEELVYWPLALCDRWITAFGWPSRGALSAARLRQERRNRLSKYSMRQPFGVLVQQHATKRRGLRDSTVRRTPPQTIDAVRIELEKYGGHSQSSPNLDSGSGVDRDG